MYIAENIDRFVTMVAEYLSMGHEVRFDLKTLTLGNMSQGMIDEYDMYLDPNEPLDIQEDDFHYGDIEFIEYLRDVSSLPQSIDRPWKSTQFDWMVDFANSRSLGPGFIRDVQRALDGRHPFRDFRYTMYRWKIEKEWFAYLQSCYEDYVRRELKGLL